MSLWRRIVGPLSLGESEEGAAKPEADDSDYEVGYFRPEGGWLEKSIRVGNDVFYLSSVDPDFARFDPQGKGKPKLLKAGLADGRWKPSPGRTPWPKLAAAMKEAGINVASPKSASKPACPPGQKMVFGTCREVKKKKQEPKKPPSHAELADQVRIANEKALSAGARKNPKDWSPGEWARLGM